jgi:hypothetical protein
MIRTVENSYTDEKMNIEFRMMNVEVRNSAVSNFSKDGAQRLSPSTFDIQKIQHYFHCSRKHD